MTAFLAELRQILRALFAAQTNAYAAVLFGSAARDELRSDSDIDIALFLDSGISAEDLLNLKFSASRAAGREVDIVPIDSGVSYALQDQVAREGIVLFGLEEERLQTFFLKAPQQYADFLQIRKPLEDEYIRRKLQ